MLNFGDVLTFDGGRATNLKLLNTYQAFLVHFHVYKGNDLNLVNDNA